MGSGFALTRAPERRTSFRKRHRLDAIALRVADEGGVIALAVLRPRPRLAVARAARGERGGVKSPHGVAVGSAHADVGAGIGRDRRHAGAMVEPEFRIALAESHGRGAIAQPGIADRAEHRLVETCGSIEVANRNGDVVDHNMVQAGAPDLTSL